jgi:hypothetical protein
MPQLFTSLKMIMSRIDQNVMKRLIWRLEAAAGGGLLSTILKEQFTI